MLRDCPGGLSVGELEEFLEDPKVRQEEKSRPATAEHVKQLRDRVENTMLVACLGSRLEDVKQAVARKSGQADARLAGIEQDIASLKGRNAPEDK